VVGELFLRRVVERFGLHHLVVRLVAAVNGSTGIGRDARRGREEKGALAADGDRIELGCNDEKHLLRGIVDVAASHAMRRRHRQMKSRLVVTI